MSAAGRARVVKAFARGTGHGLLQLGAGEASTVLAPGLAFFRDLGKLFVSRLSGTPDLEETRDKVDVAPPRLDLERFADEVPLVHGAEFVNLERLEAWWGETLEAF